ncbi:hypothetical protein SMD11_1176 [Streptomyces albireticuli]|uniref:Uncharacterized protein n=1 Tax=Streptomyces albireticuli TaxID=1940 RepID=A0A1Z2KXT0_9ACTN|nr:hypothetical protein [Streptomyces albireticuli]ARZ66839.1 hypothetical protein SMD11_1176 [Streptomyces albireticuli]
MSRTTTQKRQARERARAAQADIIKRYRAGESMNRLATQYEVSEPWLCDRLDEWKEPRRDRAAALELRRDPSLGKPTGQ